MGFVSESLLCDGESLTLAMSLFPVSMGEAPCYFAKHLRIAAWCRTVFHRQNLQWVTYPATLLKTTRLLLGVELLSTFRIYCITVHDYLCRYAQMHGGCCHSGSVWPLSLPPPPGRVCPPHSQPLYIPTGLRP